MSVIGSNILAGASGSGEAAWAGDVISTQDSPSDNRHRVYAYVWDGSGFGSRFTPSVAPSAELKYLTVSPNNNAVGVCFHGSPYVEAYSYTEGSGFGSKYSNPSTLLSDHADTIKFNPDGDVVAGHTQYSPYMYAYAFSGSGFGSKYSNPSNGSFIGYDVDWHPTGDAIAYIWAYPGSGGSYLEVWSWSSGFGSKYSNHSGSLGGSEPIGTKFSPDGTVIAFVERSSPYIHAWAWTNASGFGTKYSNPSTAARGDMQSLCWHPDGDAIVTNYGSQADAYAWDNSSGFGSKYSQPSTAVPSSWRAAVFSPDGNYLFINHNDSPYISAYEWDSSTGFGNKVSNPSTLPGNPGRGIVTTSL
jgi:hypothetical protein|tara:strand:+ start:1833 stop:2906 length:1074 start_codon:yes stop_codon:yes gene_type:complete